MQGIKYLFQNSKLFFLSVFLLINCHTTTIWNIPYNRFLTEIKTGSFEFLKEINYKKINFKDINQLPDGAAFYLSIIFSELGMTEIQEKMLLLQIKTKQRPWLLESLYLLGGYYIEYENYKKAEDLIDSFLKLYLDNCKLQQITIEAKYWQQKDKEVLKRLKKLKSCKTDNTLTNFEKRELLLFEAASSARLKNKGWQKVFVKLFSQQRSSSLHKRAWDFIVIEGLEKSFSQNEIYLFKAKNYLHLRNYKKSAVNFEKLFKSDNSFMISTQNINDAAISFIRSGKNSIAINIFKTKYPKNETEYIKNLYNLELNIGKLYRSKKVYKEAINSFEKCLNFSDNDYEKDKAIWYLIDSSFSQSFNSGMNNLQKYSNTWSDQEYFSDILDDLCTQKIGRKSWNELVTIYKEINKQKQYYSAAIIERYSFVMYLLLKNKYISDKELDVSAIFGDLYFTENLYYSFQANPKQKADKSKILKTFVNNEKKYIFEKDKDKTLLVNGYISFGLYNKVYGEIVKIWAFLDTKTIERAIKIFNRNSNYFDSIRLINKLIYKRIINLEQNDLKIIYPQGYKEQVLNAAKINNLESDLVFALIRKESLFHRTISSHAGAFGLTQLMPATGAEQARRMKINNPDLADADTNLRIGIAYLNRMIEKFDSLPLGLAAYNAGPGRVRSWKKIFKGLPIELFIEAIPYNETRNYVKNILSTEKIYRIIYGGK